MTNQEKKVPELRFPEFDGEWEEKTIGKIATTFSGGTPSSTNRSYYNGEIPFIRSGEISKSSTELMINKEAISNSSAKMVEKGDLLYALYGATSGEVAISKISGAINQAVLCIRSQESATYIFNYLKMKKDQILKTYIQGGQGNLSASIIKKVDINLPYIEEQQKIGGFFSKLDRQIELEEQKLAKLEEQKKGYMQDIFSLKLRFKDNNGNDYPEWEEKKLEDLADIVRGASPRPIKDSKWFDSTSEVGWLRISDVTNQNGKIYNLEQRLSLEGQLKTRVIASPHLLLSIAASVGKPVINFVKTGVHDGFLIFLNPKFNLIFMYNWLEMFKPKWQKYGQPGSQVNLNSELVKSQIITIPNYYEQQKIGDFFNKLDEIINNQSKKINTLKLRKQGFLQKIFV